MVGPYEVSFLAEAEEALGKLQPQAAQHVMDRLEWLAEHCDVVKHRPLSGHYRGQFRLRAGDYRVIYSLDRDAKRIVVLVLGHRKDVYK